MVIKKLFWEKPSVQWDMWWRVCQGKKESDTELKEKIVTVGIETAKTMGAKKVIARLRSTEFSHKEAVITPMDFLIDYVTYPEKAAQSEIESLVKQTSAVEI